MAKTDELRKRNADINRFRREAQEQWACASSFRQKRYIDARLQGMTPEQMWSRLSTNQVIRPDPSWRAALSEALSVLEAREAQPKMEGRPDDAEWASILKDQRMSPSFPTNEAIRREAARARSEESRLRELFDTTRHQVLRAMGADDMGHGWFWVESELGSRRASEAALSERVVTLEKALQEIQQLVMTTFAENNEQDRQMWTFHRIAGVALAPPSKPETP